MRIAVLTNRSPSQVHEDLSGFAVRYITDWERWLAVTEDRRTALFALTLGKWQATRPYPLRRPRSVATHESPYLDDLIAWAEPHLSEIPELDMGNIEGMTSEQARALEGLWDIFSRLPSRGSASCVGITKAILLLTDGRIGPALDSMVMKNLAIPRPAAADEWVAVLRAISEDLRGFEEKNGVKLSSVVPERFAHLAPGRLYDMALGPR